MEQTGEYRIAASREEVWAALNDPDVLCRCLDGCLSMQKVGGDRFDAKVKAKVGPVRATFDAQLTLEDVEPPRSYTINADVKGGPAGFARGTARVNLSDAGEQTLLAYAVNASIGGKLAQVGSRLIDGAARKMADDFFAQLRDEVQGDGAAPEATGAAGLAPDREPSMNDPAPSPARDSAASRQAASYESGGRWMIWLVVFGALLLALLFAF